MKVLVKYFSEISIKSRPVRKKLIKLLRENMLWGLEKIDSEIRIENHWDYLLVETQSEDTEIHKKIIDKLQCVSGIHSFFVVNEFEFTDFEDILHKVLSVYHNTLQGKSFVVRVKRTGEHSFRSLDVERFVGGGLLRRVGGSSVNLHNPDETVTIEIKNEKLFVAGNKYFGMGGFPIGAQGKVLSLISGGFDSPVASYLMMKRGCKLDYLFFNLGGKAHELGVKEICHHINERFSDGYPQKIITVDFSAIIKELMRNVLPRYRGVILKRMMFKVANMITAQHNYEGLVTGESLAQVSSQTLTNLNTISQASDSLIFRPVLTFDKDEIIHLAKKIKTAKYAEAMPEYCGVVSEKPATGALLEAILEEEKRFDHILLTEVFEERETIKASQALQSLENSEVETTQFVQEEDVVIDIREASERLKNPLNQKNILCIPFYELKEKMPELKKETSYLLYCEKGVMSGIHALEMKEKGFSLVKVYRPAEENVCSL